MSRRKKKDEDQSSDDEELDWLSGSYTTILDQGYEAEFGDIFNKGFDDEDDGELDADDYIMMADDDEEEDY